MDPHFLHNPFFHGRIKDDQNKMQTLNQKIFVIFLEKYKDIMFGNTHHETGGQSRLEKDEFWLRSTNC
jgi:hypothetical protein